MARLRSVALHAGLLLLIGLAMVAADVALRQYSQYRQGEAAREKGHVVEALTAYGSAIRMYVPGSPLVERSAERIWQLAEGREAAGDRERALQAYRELRSAFSAVRSITTPGTEWIARCDTQIQRLQESTPSVRKPEAAGTQNSTVPSSARGRTSP